VRTEGVDGASTPKTESVHRGTIASLGLLASSPECARQTDGGPDVADDRDAHAGPSVRAGGFDFVWHLPAVVLTVTLLAGATLPAPAGADARTPFRSAQGKESDEKQIAS
jgi:hypothetical protein